MILPIHAFGLEVLRKQTQDIDEINPEVKLLIANMFETMTNAEGIGLAAPQVGESLQLFIVDGTPIEDLEPKNFKKVFINPEIEEEWGEKSVVNEGCLSIPEVRADVTRFSKIRINYLDENFKEHTEEYSGMAARIIQHEYDHLQGIMFPDRISPLKRSILKKKLKDVSLGRMNPSYKMKYPKKNKR